MRKWGVASGEWGEIVVLTVPGYSILLSNKMNKREIHILRDLRQVCKLFVLFLAALAKFIYGFLR